MLTKFIESLPLQTGKAAVNSTPATHFTVPSDSTKPVPHSTVRVPPGEIGPSAVPWEMSGAEHGSAERSGMLDAGSCFFCCFF